MADYPLIPQDFLILTQLRVLTICLQLKTICPRSCVPCKDGLAVDVLHALHPQRRFIYSLPGKHRVYCCRIPDTSKRILDQIKKLQLRREFQNKIVYLIITYIHLSKRANEKI